MADRVSVPRVHLVKLAEQNRTVKSVGQLVHNRQFRWPIGKKGEIVNSVGQFSLKAGPNQVKGSSSGFKVPKMSSGGSRRGAAEQNGIVPSVVKIFNDRLFRWTILQKGEPDQNRIVPSVEKFPKSWVRFE